MTPKSFNDLIAKPHPPNQLQRYFRSLSSIVAGRRNGLFGLCVLACLTSTSWAVQDSAKPNGPKPDSKSEVISPLSEEMVSDGWISLFDGQTLFGWQAVTKANWKAENGELHVSEGKGGLLRTTAQFDDFELKFEFKSDERTNSGVFLRTSPKPKSAKSHCYEWNIASPKDHDYFTGALVSRAKTELKVAADTWHQVRIVCNGNKVQSWVNGQQSVDYEDADPLGRGYIGLQFKSGKVAFKNIFLKPLNSDHLFDGKNLDHWKTDQRLESTFSVTDDGELQIIGGKGQIESKNQYGDFVFSMQCKTNADGLNSGVFYRCIPGDVMNGYESQIQNKFKNNDRTDPVDCGTGGIFRRVNARYVNADDQQWFSKTIIATGSHVSVWVNGYQVTDWTDKRKPDANPRRGLRLEKGTIIFQGHDPTTDILLKNIRAKEITPRRARKKK